MDAPDQGIEIGWSFLSRAYWGGKYNQAIKKLMIEYAFTYYENVIFYINKDNIRSQKAVEKIQGKRIDGFECQHLVSKNPNMLTYIITKHRWRSMNPTEDSWLFELQRLLHLLEQVCS